MTKTLIERSRVWHNHQPQPTLDTKRREKGQKHTRAKQTNKYMRSTKTSSLFPKTNKMACAPTEDSDHPGNPPNLITWASTQSDQSLRCPREDGLGHWLPVERTAKTDQTWRMPRLIWFFAGRTSFCWFCHEATHITEAFLFRADKNSS